VIVVSISIFASFLISIFYPKYDIYYRCFVDNSYQNKEVSICSLLGLFINRMLPSIFTVPMEIIFILLIW
jgi:hypothetical protein